MFLFRNLIFLCYNMIMFDELTQKDIDDMNAEIEERIQLRSGFHDDIVMAKSYGDLSENA